MVFHHKCRTDHDVNPSVRILYKMYGIERMRNLPISLRLIREMHGRLMRGEVDPVGRTAEAGFLIGIPTVPFFQDPHATCC
jgi:Fic family protein